MVFAQQANTDNEQLTETVVTGTRTPHLIDEVPVETIVITKEMIQRSGATKLSQALGLVPNFSRTATDPTIAADTIATTFRGLSMGSGYGAILIDGKRNWGGGIGAHAGSLNTTNRIPVSMIERIEVVKGSASSLYGADAMAGVINVITRKTPKEPLITASISRGRYKVIASKPTDLSKPENRVVSPNRDSTAFSAAIGAPLGDKAGFMLFYDHRQDEGNAKLPQKAVTDSIMLKGNVKISDTLSLDADIAKDWQTKENPIPLGGQAPSHRYEREYDTLRGSISLTYASGKHNWVTTLNGQNQDYEMNRPGRGTTYGTMKNYGLESVYTYFGDKHWITVGGEVRRESYFQKSGNGTPRRPFNTLQASVTNYALFAQDEMRFMDDKLTLVPGIRLEHHSRFGTSVSPKLSAMYDFGEGLKARASIGSAFKSPGLSSLYMAAPMRHGNFEYLISNPNLKPEKAITASVGVEKRLQNFPLWMSVSGFHSSVKDKVGRSDTGKDWPGTNTPIRTWSNTEKVDIYGLEASWQLGRSTGPYLHGSAAITRSKIKAGRYSGNQLRRVPRYELTLNPGYNSPSGRWGAQMTFAHVGKAFRNDSNTQITRAHNVLDASAWLNIPTGGTRNPLRLSLNLGNLTNSDKGTARGRRYRTGRSAMLQLSGEF